MWPSSFEQFENFKTNAITKSHIRTMLSFSMAFINIFISQNIFFFSFLNFCFPASIDKTQQKISSVKEPSNWTEAGTRKKNSVNQSAPRFWPFCAKKN